MPRARSYSATAARKLLGETLEKLLPENLRGDRKAYVAQSRTRAVGRRKDGVAFPIEVSLSFVDEGESVVVLALITDITERNRMEERFRETAKLESLGVLAAGIALNGAKLTQANLSHALLVNVVLKDADLRHAYLSRVNFSGAILNGSDFSNAVLDDAEFTNAWFGQNMLV
jgi:uncharacterized protein YjbI with pentapeptide repeats